MNGSVEDGGYYGAITGEQEQVIMRIPQHPGTLAVDLRTATGESLMLNGLVFPLPPPMPSIPPPGPSSK